MSRLISWGGNQYGQLGIGSLEQQNAETPTELSHVKDVEVCQMSCGESHTLFVLADGLVYSCGNNEYGQLGHDKRQSRPEHIDGLKDQKIVQVSAGMSHSVYLSVRGEVYSSGCNMYGQLGTQETEPENCRVPRQVGLIHTVIQVSSGRNHCLALTDDGCVYTWGDNKFGQLGLGHTRVEKEPQLIGCLRGIPVSQVTCGGSHSFILSKSGTLFGWGRNCFGQLGVNDEKDRPNPTLCKSLRQQHVTYVECGEDHSAALTQSGGLFTFGAGMFGQLGHGSKTNEIMPRQVIELMGSTVTQVACGRRHTLVYVGESGRMQVFGSGSNHQLGSGSTSVKPLPELVQGPFLYCGTRNSAAMDTGCDGLYTINRIAAGGDHCFVWATQPERGVKPADFRTLDPRFQIDCFTPELISEMCSLRAGGEVPPQLEKKICKIMSSAACMNASFLLGDSGHFRSGNKNPGVDMTAVRENLTKLADAPNVVVKQKILQTIESVLIPSLPSSPPDVEALRIYLILPEFHFFDQPKYYKSLMMPLGQSINSLEKAASRVLDIWWGLFSATHFLRVVYTFKETVIHILQLPESKTPSEMDLRNRALNTLLHVLKKLNIVNEQKGQIIAYHKFYVSCVQEKINLKEDYFYWVQSQNRLDRVERVLFCNFPFLFDAAAKSLLLMTDASMQMQSAIDEVQRRNIQSLFLPTINPVNPCLVFYVSRNNIVSDTIQQLMNQGSADLKKPLKVVFSGDEKTIDAGGVKKVIFMGEEAMDEGGVRKEFFMLLLRELLDPKYGMFKVYDELSGVQWFSPFTFEEQHMYLLVGCLCGLAIYNAVIIQLDFPLALFKKLLRRTPTIEDLLEMMPTVGRGLEELLAYEGDDVEDLYCLNFEVVQEFYGEMKKVELVPGGSNKMVNKENRKEYVDQYVDYMLNRSVEKQFGAFNDGFHKVCGGRVLELFHPQELKAMVVGNENYDFHELEKNTEYKGEYHRYHQTIKLFWDVFHDLTLDDKKNFLLFLTGSNKIPIIGMKYLKMIIQPMNVAENYLPVAHTCFNLLDLPRYSTKERMKDKLLKAIQQTEGFGLV